MQPLLAKESALQRAVLLVESDVLARLNAADQVRAAGFRVLEASDGAEAFLLLTGYWDVAVVVADLRAAGSANGSGIAQWLARECPHIPVLLGTLDLVDRIRALQEP